MISARNISKTFLLYHQNSAELNVFDGLNFDAYAGSCLILSGQSGSGKSTLLRMMYGNYLANSGELKVKKGDGWIDMVNATPREVVSLRKRNIGYVSQFLKTIPRVTTLNVVLEPALDRGMDLEEATIRAKDLLMRLNIPERLWNLAPSTFSGGEQQRVNIARGFMVDWPILLLDEPTASLDEKNRDVVLGLIEEAKAKGSAVIGIFHDAYVREKVGDRLFSVLTNEVSENVC
ncbi:phosphonate C-P lyase system protein PhnL [Ignatzschineria sp. LJL83]